MLNKAPESLELALIGLQQCEKGVWEVFKAVLEALAGVLTVLQ